MGSVELGKQSALRKKAKAVVPYAGEAKSIDDAKREMWKAFLIGVVVGLVVRLAVVGW